MTCVPSPGGCATIVRVRTLPISGSTEPDQPCTADPALCPYSETEGTLLCFGQQGPRGPGGPLVRKRKGEDGSRTRVDVWPKQTVLSGGIEPPPADQSRQTCDTRGRCALFHSVLPVELLRQIEARPRVRAHGLPASLQSALASRGALPQTLSGLQPTTAELTWH